VGAGLLAGLGGLVTAGVALHRANTNRKDTDSVKSKVRDLDDRTSDLEDDVDDLQDTVAAPPPAPRRASRRPVPVVVLDSSELRRANNRLRDLNQQLTDAMAEEEDAKARVDQLESAVNDARRAVARLSN